MTTKPQPWFARHPVLSFFGLSYVIAWGIWIPTAVLAPQRLAIAVLPGAWAPTLSAILLTGLIDGKAGICQLLRRGLRWRVGLRWWAMVLFGIGLIAALAVAVHVLLGGNAPQPSLPEGVSPEQMYAFLPVIFVVNVFVGGPIAEEFGWRGFAQPRLQKRVGALVTGLIIGLVWGLWHIPFVFPEGSSVVGGISFVWYLPLVMAWSVLFAWILGNTGGSVLMMILFHASINTTLGSLGIFSVKDEGVRPLALYLALTCVVVAVVAVVYGPSRLSRKPATEEQAS